MTFKTTVSKFVQQRNWRQVNVLTIQNEITVGGTVVNILTASPTLREQKAFSRRETFHGSGKPRDGTKLITYNINTEGPNVNVILSALFSKEEIFSY